MIRSSHISVLILFLVQGLFSQTITAQIVTIPDPNFVTYLQTNFPTCITGNQLDTQCPEALAATTVDVSGLSISDLTGIQYFTSLVYLHCSNNPLDSLILPASIVAFFADNCNLTSLPELPATLANFNCSFNPITSLPALPNLVYDIECTDCQLTSLPTLPSGLIRLICNNNPDLTCLPVLPDGLYDTGGPYYQDNGFLGTGITCLPNIPSAALWTAPLPICAQGDLVNNPNNCPTTSGVYGNVFKDDNVNCTFDSGDAMLQNIKLNLIDASGDTVQISTTFSNGSYHFEGMPDGDYTVSIDTADLPFVSSSCPSGLMIPVTITGGLAVFEANFSMICESGFDIGALSAVPIGWVFPGQNHTLKMHIGEVANNFGASCVSGLNGTVQISVNGPVSYQGYPAGALAPTSIAANIFMYDVLDFGSIDFLNDFALIFTTDTTALADDTICLSIEVTPTTGDVNTANNTFHFCYPVVNSYDPNIKLVYPTRVEPNYQDWLTYTIYFQNTGTAPAFNIKLADTLSNFLIAESFQVINFSHPVVVGRVGNLLSFKFNNIMLPDSTSNPEGSIGFVQFRIKPKPGIAENESIQNKVYIYFDFNEPIITNNATTLFKSRKIFGGETLIPYPNPSNDIVQFYVPESYIGIETNVSIYNLQGEKILSYDFIPTGLISFDFSNQLPGMYILKVTSEDKKLTARFLHE
jgi:uncharacterized repeat protein (TIGR01451 family)